ncbi:hypothetical protein E5288_WYG015612 [Bos mutus]|uniref:Uncharacterized protein n=1 Tax=Bos mutus TaxID=72004 RepID=A0A6B0SDX4_9CETA|nr:hypothetical protein [Bos mutus]
MAIFAASLHSGCKLSVERERKEASLQSECTAMQPRGILGDLASLTSQLPSFHCALSSPKCDCKCKSYGGGPPAKTYSAGETQTFAKGRFVNVANPRR